MKKVVTKLLVFLGILCLYGESSAITNVPLDGEAPQSAAIINENSSVIYLVDWRDEKLHTSKGVFVTTGVQVRNNSGIVKGEVAKTNPPLVVHLVREKDVIKEFIIEKSK